MSSTKDESVTGGLNSYAQLRLRDHRPGNGTYELPPAFGPKADSLHKSILHKYDTSNHNRNPVGPGQYTLPDITGTGRAVQFGKPLDRDEAGNVIFPDPPQPPPVEEPARPGPLAKQYSLALTPNTPSYSLYGRLPTNVTSSTGNIGPGEYPLASDFDRRTWGVPEGAHFGLRTDIDHDREIPGPGTYDVKRFGDVLPAPKELLDMPRKKKAVSSTPGPGTYEDPTTIAYRLTSKPKLWQRCSFGGRCEPHKRRVGPGPAAYNITGMTRFIERKQRHAPKFRRPSGFPRRTKERPAPKNRPEIVLPSDFDYDYKKGKSMLPRWHEQDGGKSNVGPGDYDTSAKLPPPRGGRFASVPFDPYAAMKPGEAPATTMGNPYHPNYGYIEKRHPTAIINSPRGTGGNHNMAVPGPGYYNPNYDILLPPGPATVFYKGDFHERGGYPDASGPGPGEHTNDQSAYSGSIEGNRHLGKSFGIRYPAGGVHQNCKPYDATTNVNCIHADELTWQSPVIPTKPAK